MADFYLSPSQRAKFSAFALFDIAMSDSTPPLCSALSSRYVPCKNVVMILHVGSVAGEASPVLGFICRYAIDEASKSPSARGRIFFRILDHDLNCGCASWNKRAVEFARRNTFPGKLGQDRAVRKRKCPVFVGFHRGRVSQNPAEFIEGRLVRDGDHLPLAIAGRDCHPKKRRRLALHCLGDGCELCRPGTVGK